jgi:hypothetical protein
MRSLLTRALGFAALTSALACREVTGDRWDYNEMFIRGRVLTSSGAPAPGAGLQFFVFRDRAATVPCGPPTEASTVTFSRAGDDGRFAERVGSVPTGSPFQACLTVRAVTAVDTAVASGIAARFVPRGYVLDTATVDLTLGR